MIPILYSETETEYKTNGLGGLSDALTCTVTEQRNGSYELEMAYPVSGIHADDLKVSRQICAVAHDGEKFQPFRIYSITKPISGKFTVKARHVSYWLSFIATLPGEKQTTAQDALNSLKTNAASDCPFTFYSDVITNSSFQNTSVLSIRSLLGGQAGSVLDQFGGEYEFDRFKVSLLQHRGSTIPVVLEYGKNITDLQQEENIGTTYTAVIAFWKNQGTNGDVTTVTSDLVKSGNADKYPFVRTYILDCSTEYQTKPTKDALTKRAELYAKANNIGAPKVNIKLSFVALWQTEEYKNVAPLQHVHLCDTIKVRFSKFGIDASAKITKTIYNVLKDRYDSIEVGDARTSLADKISAQTTDLTLAQQRAKQQLWDSLKHTTELIRGGTGGYVVIRPDETTGYSDEILVMDTPDKDTAKQVIRINKNGIGFSLGNGYNGPFTSAWTIDGHMVADFITTGTISSQDGRTKINLDTGDLTLSSSAKLDDNTPFSQINENAAQIKESAAKIKENAAKIELKVSKTDNDQIISMINASADRISLTAGRLVITSGNFQLDEYGNITATGANLSGTLTAGTDTGKKIVIANGVLTGYSAGVEQASLNIADGQFNIIGKLALNGNVGVSGRGSYVKNIDYMTLNIPKLNPTSATANFVKDFTLSVSGGVLTADNYLNTNTSLTTTTLTYKNSYGTTSYQTVVTGWNKVWSKPSISAVSVSHSNTTGTAVTSTGLEQTYIQYTVPTNITLGTIVSKYGIISSMG